MTKFLLSFKFVFLALSLSWFALYLTGCAEKTSKSAISTQISTPPDIAVSADGSIFYVLNSNISHKYASGSLLLVDPKGEKTSSIETPTLGRRLKVSGDYLFALFENESKAGVSASSHLRLYDVSTPTTPTLQKTWDLEDCTALNVTAREGYPYFAVICSNGHLYLGEIPSGNAPGSSLNLVRSYPPMARRALLIDPERELLFGFVSKYSYPEQGDMILDTQNTYDENGEVLPGVGESDIPDKIASNKGRRLNLTNRGSEYQFFVFDIKAAREERNASGLNSFKHKTNQEVKSEFRWMYFNVSNFDGSPDSAAQLGTNKKYFRTNFWEAAPDPYDSSVFYLSQRGSVEKGRSQDANHIVRVKIVGDPRAQITEDGKSTIPQTKSFFEFARVFGFKDQGPSPKDSYYGDFSIATLNGERLLIVNSFRDSTLFEKPNYFLGLTSLDRPKVWLAPLNSSEQTSSFYLGALSKEGTLLTTSFYSNQLALYRVQVGETLERIRIIE